MLKPFYCPELRPVRHYEAEFSMKLVSKTEPAINYREPVSRNTIVTTLKPHVKFAASWKSHHFHHRTYLPYDFRSWNVETNFVYLSIGNYFPTVDRKWWGRWRFSRSEAFRVRVWYSLWAMLRHIAWTSWNRIAKKRHTRNILFALNMGDFLSSVSAFPSGSFKSREKWSFV